LKDTFLGSFIIPVRKNSRLGVEKDTVEIRIQPGRRWCQQENFGLVSNMRIKREGQSSSGIERIILPPSSWETEFNIPGRQIEIPKEKPYLEKVALKVR
jgi:hypothetical protein